MGGKKQGRPMDAAVDDQEKKKGEELFSFSAVGGGEGVEKLGGKKRRLLGSLTPGAKDLARLRGGKKKEGGGKAKIQLLLFLAEKGSPLRRRALSLSRLGKRRGRELVCLMAPAAEKGRGGGRSRT